MEGKLSVQSKVSGSADYVESFPSEERTQPVFAGQTISYRTVMEVCKFASPADTPGVIATTAQLWTKVASSNELWNSFLEQSGLPADDEEMVGLSAKEMYRKLALGPSRYLAVTKDKSLYLFDTHTNLFSKKVSVQMDDFAGAVVIDSNRVFVCGGANQGNRAFIISFATTEIVEVMNMMSSRSFHGIVAVKNNVYVFGGEINCLAAEKYCFASQMWRALPDMHTGRRSFSPCVNKQLIYLCGGNIKRCEVFNTITEAYTDLPLTLPTAGSCVSSFYKDELILDLGQTRVKWNVITQVSSTENKTRFIFLYCLLRWGNMASVVRNHSIYVSMFTLQRIYVDDLDEDKQITFYPI